MRASSSCCWRLRCHDVSCCSPALHQPGTLPYRVIVQTTGREIGWINQYLDYETLRRLSDNTLRSYAHELLHFLRWWDSVHHTDALTKDTLTESTLLDYVPQDSLFGPEDRVRSVDDHDSRASREGNDGPSYTKLV